MKSQMAKWKLTRQTYGSEEFTLSEGDEVTIGRGTENKITLSSLVISRRHCVLNVYRDKVTVKDLKSSNGTYLGSTKITSNTTVNVSDSETIGIGWADELPLGKVENDQKYVFKLCKEKIEQSLSERISYSDDIELSPAFGENMTGCGFGNSPKKIEDKTSNSVKPNLKRKSSDEADRVPKICQSLPQPITTHKSSSDVINLLSDSDNETSTRKDVTNPKKVKLEPICEEQVVKKEIKNEISDNLEYDAFKVKQEYLGYDEPINIDSDDSESESETRWFIRLSQSSPGKPPSGVSEGMACPSKNSSYTFIDESNDSLLNPTVADEHLDQSPTIVEGVEDEFSDDIIRLPTPTSEQMDEGIDEVDNRLFKDNKDDDEDFSDDLIKLPGIMSHNEIDNNKQQSPNAEQSSKQLGNQQLTTDLRETVKKKVQLIQPLAKPSRKTTVAAQSAKQKSSPLGKSSKSKRQSSSKIHITNSQKEERKKKLKDIASKGNEEKMSTDSHTNNSSKYKVNIKEGSNRGAFLTESSNTIAVKPVKRVKTPRNSDSSKHNEKDHKRRYSSSNKDMNETIHNKKEIPGSKENKEKGEHTSKHKEHGKHSSKNSKNKNNKHTDNIRSNSEETEPKTQMRTVKPFTDSEDSYSGKPISKVGPLPPKTKKSVRFADAPPQVKYFEIEPGNQMKKTSLVKVLDIPQLALEKVTLMRILRWNPHWLDEQTNNVEPPPILGHDKLPLGILNCFRNHTQYVQVIGDLLLMEIWECMTQAYTRKRNQENMLQMSLEALPPIPTTDRCLDMYNISVNVSLLKTELKLLPRAGELMLVTFGPENLRNSRFFYVHNTRCLPSPPNNVRSFFSISLQATYTDKMKILRRGEIMYGKTLSYIKNELSLFESMGYLARSPLCSAILRPTPQLFERNRNVAQHNIQSQWTATLNESQLNAVSSSVAAALGDRPSIQLIQGPPGTGKSSVICSIVMTYFYDVSGRRRPGRGKLLICATSNAAVDELVIRLLNIRQNLPKSERFRMVRVGRPEAMAARARDLSSQSLAQRDAVRALDHDTASALSAGTLTEEIGRQEARLNMWKSTMAEAKDPGRAAYCQTRINQVLERIALLRRGGGGGGSVSAEQLVATERRIIEGADIIVTTLSSAANNKMRGIRGRVALCIVDEAAQAIEPEALVPLTLDVSRLALVGDHQQLPGFIFSQRAKKHGLGESLFSRLASAMEEWDEASPVIMLDTQYRMHPAIADYPNRAFYGGKIHNAVTYKNEYNLPPYLIVAISSGDRGQTASGANEIEAWGVARLVLAVCRRMRAAAAAGTSRPSLAVLTPYNGHKDAIRKHLRTLQEPDAPEIEVTTVDSSQGQERDVVIVSLARSQGLGFLAEAGRMNVMLTRAKKTLLVCLNPNTQHANLQWRTLIEDAQQRSLVRHLPTKVCQPSAAAQSHPEDILKYLN